MIRALAVAAILAAAAFARSRSHPHRRTAPPGRPHLPPGATLTVPDGVPEGWPWVTLSDPGYLCRHSCGLRFPTLEEAETHGTDRLSAAACAELARERNAARSRAGRLRMMADPERHERHLQSRREYGRHRYATDSEYRERIRAKDRARKRRMGGPRP